jgi:hypothetical protein
MALTNNTTGFRNTATGVGTLQNNTTGSQNTAIGAVALQLNTTGLATQPPLLLHSLAPLAKFRA